MSIRAALVCYRNSTQTGLITAEFTYWDSIAQAEQAKPELTPCDPQDAVDTLCVGIHSIVGLDVMPEPRRRIGRGRPVTNAAGSGLIRVGEVEK